MNITLAPELERRVEEAIRSGAYTDANEVVSEALEVLLDGPTHEWPATEEERKYVRAALEEAWEESERGDTVSGRELHEEMVEFIAAAKART